MNTNIKTLNNDEVLEVSGGVPWAAVAVAIGAAAALIYIGGELHDALCPAHG